MQLPGPVYVFSDAHIGAATAEAERRTLAFLKWLPGRAAALVVNGDLFDFWFEWKHVIPRAGFRVLAALADLRDAGIEVLWIAGNHDCWGGDVLARDVGVTYHVGPWNGELAGWRTRIEHGDGLREIEDRKYRRLRAVLRHPLSIWAYGKLHPDFASGLATGTADASRKLHHARDGGAGLRAVAEGYLAADRALELVMFGHSHVWALDRAAGGGVYANAGAWFAEPTFVRVSPGLVELCRYDGSAEGERLDAVERAAEESLPDA